MPKRPPKDPARLPAVRRLHAVLDTLPVGIVGVDGAGLTELQNAEASRILGVSASVTLGEDLGEALGAHHPLVTLLEEVRKTEREVSSPGVVLPDRLGGEPCTVDLTVSPVVGPTGAEGAVATLSDRTLGRELEAFSDQRRRSELFARLAAGIAHEVRNPLTGIRGSAELLEGKLDRADLRRYPELIRNEVDRLRRLLDDLSELTQGADLRLRPVNLHRVLDDMLELQRNAAEWGEVEVAREYDPSLPETPVDPDRIAQVFLNLVQNAVQVMKGRGRLVVRTRLETLYQVASEGRAKERMVRIEIEDSGPGIPEADLPHVFTPFFSRREGGSGLGLPLAQHWVVRHGGRIELRSEVGRGTSVRLFLPAGRNR
jgi:two-component system nitrogen regulation sensor histidine kinase GlnL